MIINSIEKMQVHGQQLFPFYAELAAKVGGSITVSNILGNPYPEKEYILSDFYFIKTNLGFSLFLELKDGDTEFTYEIPNIVKETSSLLGNNKLKVWLECYNEHLDDDLYLVRQTNNGVVNHKILAESFGDDVAKFIMSNLTTTHRIFL